MDWRERLGPVWRLLAEHLRLPTEVAHDPDTDTETFTFEPPLSPAEQAVLTRLRAVARLEVSITPAEWESIEADIAGLTTYQGLPSPTQAQTVLAVKAQSRILRALLRD